jgi:hypothetical protein
MTMNPDEEHGPTGRPSQSKPAAEESAKRPTRPYHCCRPAKTRRGRNLAAGVVVYSRASGGPASAHAWLCDQERAWGLAREMRASCQR